MAAQFETPAGAVRAHEELFAYWASLRSDGRLPSRRCIHPGGFKRHLPGVSLIEVSHEPRDYRMRLAGTGLYRVYGRETTGLALRDVFPSAEAHQYWRRELDRVVDDGRPAAGVHSLSWRGAGHLSILWLRLPLAMDGKRVNMILGFDALVGVSTGRGVSGIRAA